MTDANSRENCLEEAARGDEALAAADCLLRNGFFRDAVPRAYYAAFHWASTLLLTRGLQARTHRGVVQLLHLHFVKDGPLRQADGALLGQLATSGELGDYVSGASFDREEASAQIAASRRFIDACRPVLEHVVGEGR